MLRLVFAVIDPDVSEGVLPSSSSSSGTRGSIRTSPREVCGGQSSTETVFFPGSSVLLFLPPVLHTVHSCVTDSVIAKIVQS